MLLLPTGVYSVAGVMAVALTVIVIGLVPPGGVERLFATRTASAWSGEIAARTISLISLAVLAALIWLGAAGPHDPLANLLPLAIWTVWWIAIVGLHAIAGDVWRYLNPWTGIYALLFAHAADSRMIRLPRPAGSWPAVIIFLLFAMFYLAYPAPDDPERLAVVAGGYWLFTFVAMVIFGARDWLRRGECFSVLMSHYASIAPIGRHGDTVRFGMPGWRIVSAPALSISGSAFVIMLLATGSFDGLNETFWWLAWLGINPLEFPGRSAVIWPTVAGLVGANILLVAAFALTVFAGLALVGETARFAEAFGRLARTILPIAAAYHAAHYLVSLLVNGQYVAGALNDPLKTGADIFGIEPFYVTTGFLNATDSVRLIWLTQAGVIVIGHMLAVLLSHAIAVDMFTNARKATISQIPQALFMIVYTLFGLWLLAAPRGA